MFTYRDITSYEEAWQVFVALSESVARRLRENGFRCRTVQINVRDNELNWFERQAKLQTLCCTVTELSAAAMKLFRSSYSFSKPLRSLGVRACDLVDSATGLQYSFFDDSAKREREETIETVVDRLRERFGKTSILRATLLGADIIGESDPLTHDVHPVSYNVN